METAAIFSVVLTVLGCPPGFLDIVDPVVLKFSTYFKIVSWSRILLFGDKLKRVRNALRVAVTDSITKPHCSSKHGIWNMFSLFELKIKTKWLIVYQQSPDFMIGNNALRVFEWSGKKNYHTFKNKWIFSFSLIRDRSVV